MLQSQTFALVAHTIIENTGCTLTTPRYVIIKINKLNFMRF